MDGRGFSEALGGLLLVAVVSAFALGALVTGCTYYLTDRYELTVEVSEPAPTVRALDLVDQGDR